MRVIVGLGNPGKQYLHTRHNAGFLVMDELATRWEAEAWRDMPRFQAQIAPIMIAGQKCLLVKPQTYMNLSGESVGKILAFYGATKQDILVISDDIDLAFAVVRERTKGSSGGQNGLKSLIAHLGSDEFARIKIGIWRPAGPMEISDWVLSRFSSEELGVVRGEVSSTVQALLERWIGRASE